MRVLVTGAGGLLGGRLAACLHERGLDVVAVHRRTPPPDGPHAVAADLLADGALDRLLDAERPQGVVHAAVLGRADLCQERPADARATNALLPGRVAAACAGRGIRLVALSTDLVFGGEAPPYRESDPTRPLGVYGLTKAEGERSVLDAFPGAAIGRVALVYGRGHGARGTASESVAWALRAGRRVQLFTDEYRTPVDAWSVADAAFRMLARPARGLFHLGGPERLSRWELGVRVARALGLPEAGLTPGVRADYQGQDPRAADVSLDNEKARRELGWEPRAIDEAVREGRPGPA